MAAPILDNIGPQIFVSQSYEKPYSATSQKFLFATAARKVALDTRDAINAHR